jgi:hypothetical protein
MSGQFEDPPPNSGNGPPVPIGQEVGWTPRLGLGDVQKRKFLKILPGLELRPLVVQILVTRCTDYTIPSPVTII